MAQGKPGPITSKFVETQTKSPLAGVVGAKQATVAAAGQVRAEANSIMRNTAAITKYMQIQATSAKTVQQASAATENTEKTIEDLRQRNLDLTKAQGAAAKANNTELQEHYKKLISLTQSQIKHLQRTVAVERQQLKVTADIVKLENKSLGLAAKKQSLSKQDTKSLEKAREEQSRLNNILSARNKVEKLSLANNKSIAEARKEALKSEKDRNDYLEKLEAKSVGKTEHKRPALQKPPVSDDVEPADPREGKSSGLMSGLSGLLGGGAAALAAVSGYEAAKSGLVGLVRASDIATESQYHFGTSLDRADKSMQGYYNRTKKVISLNTNIGLSYARMGLDAETAAEVVPKLLSGSGVALKAFQENNTKLVEDMAGAVGAFSRQTGVSLDDAIALQNNMITVQGKTADEAKKDLNSITGAIQGMNNYLQDAGFQGALLNIGDYASMAKEAAENTEDLTFNTSEYTKQLAKAAGNVRLMGATEKEAQKFATAKGKLYEQKNPFVDMQVGRKMVASLQSEYAEMIKSGDVDKITESLVSKYKLVSNQAALISSMLTSKKPIPMMENQFAEILRGSAISMNTINSTLDEWFKKTGITSPADVANAANDPQLLSQLGLDWTDPQDRLTAVDYAQDYLMRKNLAKPDPERAKRLAALQGREEEYQNKAAEQAASKNVEANAPPSIGKIKEHWDARMSNPLFSLGLAGLVGAGALHYGSKVLKSGAGFLGRLGKGGVTADAVGSTAKAADAAVESSLKAAAKAESGIGPKLLKLAMHNKKLALIAAGAGGLYGLDKLMDDGSDDAKTPEQQKIETDNTYIGTHTENLKTAGTNLVLESLAAGGMKAGKYGISKLTAGAAGKAAEEAAVKATASKATALGLKAIPFIGALASAGLTYASTEGDWKRKTAATTGDVLGGLAGSFAGTPGSIGGSIAGQFAGATLYDWLAGEGDKNKLQTAGTSSAVGKLDAAQAKEAAKQVTGTATTAAPEVIGASIGGFGSPYPDGSVPVTITARVRNFTTAVAQANTQNFARQTQFSGAQK